MLQGLTGEVAASAEVTLTFPGRSPRPVDRFSGKTGADGRAVFHDLPRNRCLISANGTDAVVYTETYTSIRGGSSERRTRVLVYSDRSIYRPGQTVHFKSTACSVRGGVYSAVPDMPLTMSLIDPNNEQVEEVLLTTNEFGTASGSFIIPKGRLLGHYKLRTPGGLKVIRVEEYKRPTFDVTLEGPVGDSRLNSDVRSGNRHVLLWVARIRRVGILASCSHASMAAVA